jgi:hypothetical protein
MRRILSVCALGAGLLLLTAIPASAQSVRLTASLSGGEETPSPGLNTGAFGTADVAVDTANQEITVALQVWNLPTGSTAGHIHAGSRGTAGPIILDFFFPAGRTGDFSMNIRVSAANFLARPAIGINTIDDAIQAVLAGNAYVNVHTTQYPAGEIRGQLVRVTP